MRNPSCSDSNALFKDGCEGRGPGVVVVVVRRSYRSIATWGSSLETLGKSENQRQESDEDPSQST